MQKKEANAKAYAARMMEQFRGAMERLRKLGARMMEDRGRRVMYVPGNVCLCSSYPIDMFGTSVAANSRSHKQHLRANHLGKFRKGK